MDKGVINAIVKFEFDEEKFKAQVERAVAKYVDLPLSGEVIEKVKTEVLDVFLDSNPFTVEIV